ncbi:MAG: LptF/LptG family permease [Spirochaetes bacterium]|nr:LptF/LptG family permease [Spirochaetota bacterium]MBU1082207.1 LptF/LptG family permease [Spirochaetota bacterium]
MRRRVHATLWKYVGKEFLLSFIVAFLFFFIIFFINQLLLMAEDILSKKAPVGDVVRLVLYATPAIVAMSFPFGSLVGALMATGRLASDNELLVMRASGVSRPAIMAPFIVLGVAFSLVSFVMNDYFLPLGTINYGKLYRKLITTAPALELKPYSVKRYRDTTIVMGAMEGGVMMDVVILDTTKDGKSRVISAGRASLVDRGDSSGVISMMLDDVFVQESDPGKPERFEYSTADRMEYNILLTSFSDFSSGVSPREMSSVDVASAIRKKQSILDGRLAARAAELDEKRSALLAEYLTRSRTGSGVDGSLTRLVPLKQAHESLSAKPLKDRSLDIYRLEYYKKFSIPAGALCFVFLAFPLGARARKSGKAVGFGLGLLVAVAYWGLLIGGQTLGLRTGFDSFLAMWAPNILVLVVAAPFLIPRGSS